MTTIKLTVSGAEISAQVSGVLTAGMAGIPVTLEYDAAWDGMFKTLVCMGEDVRCVPNVQTQATVAPEVMGTGKHLFLGVEGVNEDGSVIIPTLWADCGPIQPSARSDCDETAGAALPVWQQIWRSIGDLEQLKTADRSCLVAAINELAGASGGAAGGGTGGGLSGEAAALLIEILRAGVYSSDQSGQIAALEQKLLGTTPPKPPAEDWVISYNLIGCRTNGAASAAPGSRYEAVLTPFEGYRLSTVRVLMGGQDVTQQAYQDGTVTISAVTGDVHISATAVEMQKTYPITLNLTHVTAENPAVQVPEGSSYQTALTADEGYALDTVKVTMGGKDITASAYMLRQVNIKSVTGAVSITAAASKQEAGGNGWKSGTPYTLTYPDTGTIDESNGTVTGGRNNSVTDFLPCQGVEMIRFDFGQSSDVYNLAWYDENKNFITTQQSSAIQTEFGPYLPVKNKAAYLRVEKRENRWISEITPFVFPAATSGKYVKGQIYKMETLPGYLNVSDGKSVSDDRYDYTKEYIFVYGASTITMSRYERKTICWYDGQKVNLSDSFAGMIGRDYPIPAEATYLRVSGNRGFVDYIRID